MTASEKLTAALRTGNIEEINQALDSVIATEDVETLADWADSFWDLGFLDEAQKVLLVLKEKAPENNNEWNLTLAEIAVENDEIDEAFEYLFEIPEDSREYTSSLMIQADLYQVLGMPEVSENKLKEAKKRQDEDPIIDFAMAELARFSGDYETARNHYQRLLEKGEDFIVGVPMKERLGNAMSMVGQFEEAATLLEEVVEEDRSDDHLFSLAYTYFQGDEREKAIPLFQELLEKNDTYHSAYYFLAEALKDEERDAEALEVVKAGINHDPFQVRLFQLAAEISYRLRQTEEAESYLLKAIELGEGADNSILALANMYLYEERYEEAVAILKKLEEVDGYAKWRLGQAHRYLDEDEKALPLYQEASDEMGHDPGFMRDYGLYLREIGRMDESNHILEHYLHHVADDLEIESLLNNDDLTEF